MDMAGQLCRADCKVSRDYAHYIAVLDVSPSLVLFRWAMGDAEEAVLFIRECLHMDAVLEVRVLLLGSLPVKFFWLSVFWWLLVFHCCVQIIEEVEGPSTVSMQPQEDQ